MYCPFDKLMPVRCRRSLTLLVATILFWPFPSFSAQKNTVKSPLLELVNDYCISCHNPEKKKGKLDLKSLLHVDMAQHLETWKEVAWMLREREMPPDDEPRPSEADYSTGTDWLDRRISILNTEKNKPPAISSKLAMVNKYCVSCHNGEENKSGLNLDAIRFEEATQHSEIWEKVITRLQSRQMPPPNRNRPSEQTYAAVLESLTTKLDKHTITHPKPGRVATFRRLNRTEYQNSIRDLLGVDIDASSLLPKDEESYGFDNVTVGTLSPSLVDRYISAAQKISHLAVGRQSSKLGGDTFRVPPDYTQEKHVEGLPIGTRGGALLTYTFPQDGAYEFEVLLSRDRNEHVEGLNGSHEMEILIDRAMIERFTVMRIGDASHKDVDKHLKTRTFVQAGPRKVGVTFLKKPYSLLENKRQPFEAHFNFHRHPRLSPAVYQISITGPFEAKGAHKTPSRKKIFIKQPSGASDEEPIAREILTNLMKRAFRRAIVESDLMKPMTFYRNEAHKAGYEAGIESALNSILVSPEFLFRIEKEPIQGTSGTAYRISDLELASRLSFFIWSSLPDEALLDSAIAGRLSDSNELEKQVRRMLADHRSNSLTMNFASQWLHLRNLDSIRPDLRRYPDFDDNLRQAFRKETELFVESIFREDHSVLKLLNTDYTFLNERLAHHYGISGIYGSRFRRVTLDPKHKRGGLLRQGSILTVTSYATRTSPVIRGNWVLENIIGTPPPPPPANIPALEENKVDATLSMRERLAEHRANPACASCHDRMDPVGFALENFDAVGRWRDFENGTAIDVSGGLPDGSTFVGVEDLEHGLLKRPELFVRTLSEKLLTFALGRGVEFYDAPAIRQIVREAKAHEFRFSSIILGITKSIPFQMRATSKDPIAETHQN
ncbi:MAG TPA: DUF1592 domain-containing protein [Verrucomicrobiales bacterium]|nr:DUF1592 domain-containing protein [Verrucomicrobiales bacterium]